MPGYKAIRSSRIPWIGDIPLHWKMVRMKHILQNVSEKNHPDAMVLSLYREYGVLPKDSRDDNHNVTSLDTGSYKLVRRGELVINKMKAWQGSLGVSDYEGIVSPAYYVCKFISDEVDKKYIHYLLRCKAYAQEFERLSTGMRVGQWDLGIDDFMSVPALIPPKSEQEAIVVFLNDKCSQIDALIQEAKSSIDEYRQWRTAAIFEMVTKGVDASLPLRDSGEHWIGNMPTHWSKAKIGHCFKTIGSGTTPKSDVEDYYTGDIPWLQSGDINGGIVLKTSKCLNGAALKKYSALKMYHAPYIAIAMYGASIANICVVNINSCTNQACCVLSDPEDHIMFLYAKFALQAAKTELILSSRGGTQPNISQEIIKQLKIPLPTCEEQRKISATLDTIYNYISSIIDEKESLIIDLESYKRALIFEIVTGKRKVV